MAYWRQRCSEPSGTSWDDQTSALGIVWHLFARDDLLRCFLPRILRDPLRAVVYCRRCPAFPKDCLSRVPPCITNGDRSPAVPLYRSEEHTSELQSQSNLV